MISNVPEFAKDVKKTTKQHDGGEDRAARRHLDTVPCHAAPVEKQIDAFQNLIRTFGELCIYGENTKIDTSP